MGRPAQPTWPLMDGSTITLRLDGNRFARVVLVATGHFLAVRFAPRVESRSCICQAMRQTTFETRSLHHDRAQAG